jgi:2-oxoisovalerate dehydrogenase E1 component
MRTQAGATPGACAQHSQSLEAVLAHIPGLKVAMAATPNDAYALIRAAASDPDPCIVIESRALYAQKGTVQITDGAEMVGRARFHRHGTDIGIITWGTMVPRVLAASDALESAGLRPSVLDLRWLKPLDEEALREIVSRVDGKVLIVHEAVRTGGFAGEIALRLNELNTDNRALRIRRLTTPDTRIPASPVLQRALLPNEATIEQAARSLHFG